MFTKESLLFLLKKVAVLIIVSFMMVTLVPPLNNLRNNSVQAASTIIITNPNGTNVVPETEDFSINAYSDPWDMNQLTDVASGHYYENITNFSIAGGILSGQSSNSDPQFFSVFPSYLDAYPVGRDGLINRIDTSQYGAFSIRMYSSSSGFGQVFWFYNQIWTDFGVATFAVSSGWNTYKVDLTSYPSWTGQPIGLRVDPINVSGVNFQVDWVKLHKTGTAANTLNIQWTDSSPGGNASIYLDYDTNQNNGNEEFIASRPSNASNSYSLDTSAYLAGTYYIFLKKGGENSASASFSINQPPLIEVLDPDDQGGEDYATATSGDPWDTNQITDFSASANAYNIQITGVMSAVNSNDDPHFYLRLPTPINTDRYHRLTFRFRYDNEFNFGYGTMARFIWNPNGIYGPTFQTSDDIVVYPEWTTYTVDLKNIKLDYGNIGWNGLMTSFRFDPLEVPTPRWFHLDYIKLAADDEAQTSFPIKWQDNRASPPSTTVRIYYDTDKSGFNGTLIAQNISQANGVNTYNWNVKPVPPGFYYVYITANDGANITQKYSSGPIRILDKNWHVKKSTGSGFEAGTSWTDIWGNPRGETPLVGDFNGDLKDDIGIYRASNAGWYGKFSTGVDFQPDTNISTAWGNPGEGDTPLVGDFNGDLKDDIGIYRRTSYPNWFVNLSTGSGFSGGWGASWGNLSGETPIVGDFNGDGRDDIGIYRASDSSWHLRLSTGSGFSPGWNASWGNTWDSPLVGDFNGDGKDDIGIYRRSSYPNWFVNLSTGSGFSGGWGASWGNFTETPLVGDFNGDLKSDIGIYRASNTGWYLQLSTGSGFTPSWATSWGNTSGDTPLIGDFNGDSKTDIGLHRRF